jgi:hypothetical protein
VSDHHAVTYVWPKTNTPVGARLALGAVLLERVRALPDGQRKADEAKRMIDRVRPFSGYRKHPTYGLASRYFVYKQGLARRSRALRAGPCAC